jgi:hypothetical protein
MKIDNVEPYTQNSLPKVKQELPSHILRNEDFMNLNNITGIMHEEPRK